MGCGGKKRSFSPYSPFSPNFSIFLLPPPPFSPKTNGPTVTGRADERNGRSGRRKISVTKLHSERQKSPIDRFKFLAFNLTPPVFAVNWHLSVSTSLKKGTNCLSFAHFSNDW